ncbi:MAG TPA: pyridoxal phosphate-dependent aminotransferase [Alphaproteobacteria bacterium]|nr:pyridoxal phosphate-dependent aminotransferase [Alphaproteobacteria bacterium]
MKYSSLVERIAGEGADAWIIHERALARVARGEDVFLLSVGDPDFDTPSPAVEAAVDSLRRGDTHYTPITGDPDLRAAIAERYRVLEGREVDPASIVVVPGAQCGLFCVAQCLLEPGDEVIVPEPKYVTYDAFLGATGAKVVEVPLDRERGFHLNLPAIAGAIGPRTKAIVLNTPHNPTGAVLERGELEAVAALCREHDLWLISDEVYASLTYEDAHLSPAALPGMAERTVVVNSLSKSHAMTGWRLGWVVAPGALPHHLANLALCMLYGSPRFVQEAGVAALRQATAEVDRMRSEYRRRRDCAAALLGNVRGIECLVPEGGMFLMLDIRGTGLDAFGFAAGLLDEEAVSVLPGDGFGPSGAGHIRMSLTEPRGRLEEACRRIEAFVERAGTSGIPDAAA